MLLSPFCAQLPAEERDVDHAAPAHRPASLHAHLTEDEDERKVREAAPQLRRFYSEYSSTTYLHVINRRFHV